MENKEEENKIVTPADEATVNKMANAVCAAMKNYDEYDDESAANTAQALGKIYSSNEYGNVTEEQFHQAMEKNCKEGWEKFLKLIN